MTILATAIGSLPHRQVKEACEIMLRQLPQAPPWPQLPKRTFKENMYAQYSEKMPCLKIDKTKGKVYFDTNLNVEVALERFYERYLSEDVNYFALSQEYAAGFYGMMELLSQDDIKRMHFLKGHVTGPISFGLTVTDQNGKASLYHNLLFDAIVKGIAMKALWQVQRFRERGAKPLIFLDEPYLAAFGSVYINLSKKDGINALNEVIEVVQQAGGLTGIHCCGNTDWSLVAGTKVDIISFDAYHFTETLALYPAELNTYLKRGGRLAWGIVPTSKEELNHDNIASLNRKLNQGLELLANKRINPELLYKGFFITPSCGVGSLSERLAEQAIELTSQLCSHYLETARQ